MAGNRGKVAAEMTNCGGGIRAPFRHFSPSVLMAVRKFGTERNATKIAIRIAPISRKSNVATLIIQFYPKPAPKSPSREAAEGEGVFAEEEVHSFRAVEERLAVVAVFFRQSANLTRIL